MEIKPVAPSASDGGFSPHHSGRLAALWRCLCCICVHFHYPLHLLKCLSLPLNCGCQNLFQSHRISISLQTCSASSIFLFSWLAFHPPGLPNPNPNPNPESLSSSSRWASVGCWLTPWPLLSSGSGPSLCLLWTAAAIFWAGFLFLLRHYKPTLHTVIMI